MLRVLIAIAALMASACEAVPVAGPRVWVPPEPTDTVITPAWAERAPSAGEEEEVGDGECSVLWL